MGVMIDSGGKKKDSESHCDFKFKSAYAVSFGNFLSAYY